MGRFLKLKNVDLPYKANSLHLKDFLNTSEPFYQSLSMNKVEEDGLTILDDFEFQGIDFDNIRDDEFQIHDDDDDDEDVDSPSSQSPNQSLNFQEYSVSYMEKDSTIKIVNFKKDIIDEADINKQAQSSPKLRNTELDHMIYNLSLEELDFQLRGSADDSLDTKDQRVYDDSFNLEELLNSVNDQSDSNSKAAPPIQEISGGSDDFYGEEQEAVIIQDGDDEEDEEEDTMDIDIVLPESSSSMTSTEDNNSDEVLPSSSQNEDNFSTASTLQKLDGFLNSSAKASKIPIRYYDTNNIKSSKFQIHQDPIKTSLASHRLRISGPSLYQQTLKKSARLQPQEYHRILKSPKRICSPKKSFKPLKSAIKIRKNLLNLIVDAASGDQREAARYGSEINSQNGEGVPLPESTKELVTIPTNNVKETSRAAIIKAILPMLIAPETNALLHDITNSQQHLGMSKVGFYNESDFFNYLNSKKKSSSMSQGKENSLEAPAKRLKTNGTNITFEEMEGKPDNKRKLVKWAENLEW